MITVPETNPIYTDSEKARLETYNKKLTLLSAEIENSTKAARALKDEIASLIKEIDFLKQYKEDLSTEYDDLVARRDRLQEEIKANLKALEGHTKTFNDMKESTSVKAEELVAYETSLADQETDLKKRQDKNTEENKILSREKALVEKAKNAFLTALESIVWK